MVRRLVSPAFSRPTVPVRSPLIVACGYETARRVRENTVVGVAARLSEPSS
jgi:hypothetical protein